jgi:hypothetical protein
MRIEAIANFVADNNVSVCQELPDIISKACWNSSGAAELAVPTTATPKGPMALL